MPTRLEWYFRLQSRMNSSSARIPTFQHSWHSFTTYRYGCNLDTCAVHMRAIARDVRLCWHNIDLTL